MALLSVNAIGCAATPRFFGPAHEPRDWLTYLRVPGLAPSASERLSQEPARLWSTGAGRQAAGPVTVGDSVLVAATTEGTVTVLARGDGKAVWRRRLDSPAVGGALVADSMVYAVSGDGRVYAWQLSSGRARWSRDVTGAVGLTMGAGGQLICAARGTVVALDLTDGRVRWRWESSGPLRTSPTAAGSVVVVATDDSLVQLDAGTGAVIARAAARGLGLSPPAVADSVLVYSSPQGRVVGVHRSTLAPLWQVELGEPLYASPVVARDSVYAVTIDGTLWFAALRAPHLGSRTSLGITVRAPPLVLAEGVLIPTVAGEVIWVVPPEAVPRWKIRVDGPLEQPPVIDRGLLVFMDGRGKVQAWR